MATYKEAFHPKIKSDLKKIDKSVVKKIQTHHLEKIVDDPYRYETLKGVLSNLRAYHFKESGVEYRIAYEVTENQIIFYYMIAKRENFYKKIKSRI